MATFASSSCSTRVCKPAGAVRQPCTTAVARPAAAVRQQQLRSVQAFAAVEDDVIDLDEVKLQGPSTATGAAGEEDAQEYSMQELLAAAEATHYNSLAVADIEASFLEGTADQEVASYLSGLQAEAEDLLLQQGKGPGVEEAGEAIAAAAAELAETGDVPEAPVVAELGRRPLSSRPRDVLEPLSNDEAIAARKVVAALKLTKRELAEELVPEDWDATTVDWFSNKEETDVPLPEYKLVFLWLDKTLACAIDQVYARGNSAPLTEYYMWPREDAWEELKLSLDAKPWVGETETVQLLNRLTMVINFWTGQQQFDEQGNPVGDPLQPSIEEARAEFSDCTFVGASAP